MKHLDWVVTVPKTINWNDYLKEINDVEKKNLVINYKASYIPKDMKVNDRMWIVHNGRIRGFMKICSFGKQDGFVCQTSGKKWANGNYIQRSGKFYELDHYVAMKGFQGLRKLDIQKIVKED